MVRFTTWFLHTMNRWKYISAVYNMPPTRVRDHNIFERGDDICRSFTDKLTFLHYNKGEGIEPRFGTLLIRKIPAPNTEELRVGDVVLVKDPRGTDYIVRKLAAVEGWEMGSHDPKKNPFVLEKDDCWILSENKELSPKEAYDSRTFGKFYMPWIYGRAIYCLRSAEDHGPVENSRISGLFDGILIEKELDLDEMIKFHEAATKE